MKAILTSLAAVLFFSNASMVSAAPKDVKDSAAVYQIVKATDSRVWRLNKQTGEMSVCSIDG